MKENKGKELTKYILENYEVKDANDVALALKDMFKDTIQTMMNAEFDTSIGYEKSDNKIEKNNYRNGYSYNQTYCGFYIQSGISNDNSHRLKICTDIG